MAEIPRLNGVIKALEEGKTAFVSFTSNDIETAVAMAGSKLDGVAFEMEHAPLDIPGLRHSLQYMLDRRQVVDRGTLTPAVTPMVRIPPNGNEMNQWLAKQVLDIGVYGIIFPHVSSVEEARNAVSACRYPRLASEPLYDPPGIRGDAPTRAARYWGLTQQEYYKRADVWPLAPDGEILVVIQCEEVRAIENLQAMLKEVPGIGVVLIGEGRPEPGTGPPARLRPPGGGRSHQPHPGNLQGARRPLRPPPSQRRQHRTAGGGGLPLPHAQRAAFFRRAQPRPRADGTLIPRSPNPSPRT